MWYEVTRTRVVTEVTHIKANSHKEATRLSAKEKYWLTAEEETFTVHCIEVPETQVTIKEKKDQS